MALQHDLKSHKRMRAGSMLARRTEALITLQEEVEDSTAVKKHGHDEVYASKFASSDEAKQVEGSTYESLAQYHRRHLPSQTELNARPAAMRGNWRPYF